MTRHHRLSAIIIVAAGVTLLAAAEPVKFDGARAYEHIRQVVSFGPRPAGSAALDSTRRYVKGQLAAFGVQAIEQRFDADTPIGRIKMANLVATIPGPVPDTLIFAGHYDTKLFRDFRFVGANDAGSSTAFLIELGRVLKARRNRMTIELLFLDGEEATGEWVDDDHTYGSRHYVAVARKEGTLRRIRAMILVDMIGDRDLKIRREEASTGWLTDVIWASARRLKLDSAFVNETMRIEDDHVPFLEGGVPAVDIIDFDNIPWWHTAGDTLDKVSARSLQTVGDVLVGALPQIEDRLVGTTRGTKGTTKPAK